MFDTVSDDGPSNPVCEGETCVFDSESCTTFAVNAKTGKLKWSWWLGDPETSSPTIANGLVFASFPAAAYGYISDADDEIGGSYTGKTAPKVQKPSGATHVSRSQRGSSCAAKRTRDGSCVDSVAARLVRPLA